MRESGNDKGAGNWGSHPSSSVLLALVTAHGLSFSATRRYSCFPFSLSPSSFILPCIHPFLDSPLPPRPLSVSLTLSALRLFTLLIPQHPPRNNDVGPCFSCFSPFLLSFLFLSFFLSIFFYRSIRFFLFFILFFAISIFFYHSNIYTLWGRRCSIPATEPPLRFFLKNEECLHIFPHGAWETSRRKPH